MQIAGFTLEQWFAAIQAACVAAGLISAQLLAIRVAWHRSRSRVTTDEEEQAEPDTFHLQSSTEIEQKRIGHAISNR